MSGVSTSTATNHRPTNHGEFPARVRERQQTVGEGPERDHLVGRPDRHTAGHCPEHVVPDLVAEEEGGVASRKRAGVELELRALALEHVKVQVQASIEEKYQCQVSQEHERDPAGLEAPHAGEVRCEEEPGHERNDEIGGVHRPQIAGESEQPPEHRRRPRWPGVEGREVVRMGRPPAFAPISPCD